MEGLEGARCPGPVLLRWERLACLRSLPAAIRQVGFVSCCDTLHHVLTQTRAWTQHVLSLTGWQPWFSTIRPAKN